MSSSSKGKAKEVISIDSESEDLDFEDVTATSISRPAAAASRPVARNGGTSGGGVRLGAGPSKASIEDVMDDGEVEKLEQIADEIAAIDAQIRHLNENRRALQQEEAKIKKTARDRLHGLLDSGAPLPGYVDYYSYKKHSKVLTKAAQKYWKGFKEFRYSQESVCNAMLDGRDVLVIMPTGELTMKLDTPDSHADGLLCRRRKESVLPAAGASLAWLDRRHLTVSRSMCVRRSNGMLTCIAHTACSRS